MLIQRAIEGRYRDTVTVRRIAVVTGPRQARVLVQVNGRGLSFHYITHDLVSAHQIADRIVVMFGGRIVESGPADAVVRSPGHPYTRVLLEAIPGAVSRPGAAGSGGGRGGGAGSVVGEERTARAGCPFAARCTSATPECRTTAPPTAELSPRRTRPGASTQPSQPSPLRRPGKPYDSSSANRMTD